MWHYIRFVTGSFLRQSAVPSIICVLKGLVPLAFFTAIIRKIAGAAPHVAVGIDVRTFNCPAAMHVPSAAAFTRATTDMCCNT